MTAMRALATDVMSGLEAVDLAEVMRTAELTTRMDRKYLVPLPLVPELLTDFRDRLRALQIDDLRAFSYRSVYFDTPQLRSYRDHVQGRRRRFKVRTRSYLHSGQCQLEVKTKGGRSHTVKQRLAYPAQDADRLNPVGEKFVADSLSWLPEQIRLFPALETHYLRSTLLDPLSRSRITCDFGVSYCDPQERTATLKDVIVVETKTANQAGPVDRWLWRRGIRPQRMSKYCIGVALMHPDLPRNPWHRLLRRYFEPDRLVEPMGERFTACATGPGMTVRGSG